MGLLMSRNDEFTTDFDNDPVDAMAKIELWRNETPTITRDHMKGKHTNWMNRKRPATNVGAKNGNSKKNTGAQNG
jgi:hypothetical protein